ncbi:MAG TPA: hypothetical protein VHA52_06080 [Candidatus Babeliaceae bacterium]|nr:hypothetical protein [Candidatus Babeliaceae bacterium]
MSERMTVGAVRASVNGLNGMAGYGRRVRRRRRGGDFLGIGNFFRRTLPAGLKKAGQFIKDKRLLSTGIGLIPHPGGKVLATGLRLAGLGRRRRVRRRGGNLKSMLKKAHEYVKEKRLISSALRHFLPKSNAHKIAHILGYGRRRRVRRRRGGDLKSMLKKAHAYVKEKRLISSALKHFLPKSNASKIAHIMGYGRRRRVRRRAGGSIFSRLRGTKIALYPGQYN